MGTCLSKKKPSSSSSSTAVNNGAWAINGAFSSAQSGLVSVPLQAVDPLKLEKQKEEVKEEEHPTQVKKEIFIIKHRRSHDERGEPNPKNQNHQSPLTLAAAAVAAAPEDDDESASSPAHQLPVSVANVRTSSCTKEEVDAILIQCGRLSRSSSGKAASSSSASRKYSGSKRSYDFDHNDVANAAAAEDGAVVVTEESRRHRDRRQSSRSRTRASPSPQGRRRTPSRERGDGQQRSVSRERRVSRSPGRRSATETTGSGTCSNTNTNANTNTGSVNSNRPGKMVSVPATVSSLVMDKSNNGDSAAVAASVKRITVKRNVGETGAGAAAGSRGAASPRSQSPARANGNVAAATAKLSSNECQQQQQPSLSRNSSRKAEQSPYRRNPLSEIDPNSLAYPHTNTNNNINKPQNKNRSRETEGVTHDDNIFIKEPSNVPNQVQKPNTGTNYRSSSRVSAAKEQQAIVETTVLTAGLHKPSSQMPTPTITRSRSARRSRDLDFNPEALLHPNSNSDSNPSYTSLLLEDIQNFHQKNTTTTTTTVVSLPPCVSKACSILEAVADLNSTTGSNLSEDQFNSLLGSTPKSKDPFVESEVVIGCDDLTEPSFHKYVTVRRGGGDAASDDQESSGSNSIVQQQQQWGSGMFSSSSADSTDCRSWRSNDEAAEGWRRVSERSKRDSYSVQPHSTGGIGRGRLGSAKGLQTVSVVVASST